MAAPTTLSALLDSLTQSLSSAQDVTAKLSTLEAPTDGVSLLDVKNQLMLSYLQNLVFLILVKIRNAKPDLDDEQVSELTETVRSKLVEQRLYLEKGARPLEEKLRFSIEGLIRKSQDAQRVEKQNLDGKARKGGDSDPGSGSDEDDSESEVENNLHKSKGKLSAPGASTMRDERKPQKSDSKSAGDGIYRAPKRDRQVMDTPASRREKPLRRPGKSHTMDEFINSELSSAPMAEPSVGTTIVQGGRRMKTDGERKVEAERQTYEESNFVRLPAQSKKDRIKQNRETGRSARMQFGGEEWHNLGEGVARIDRLTRRKEGSGGVRAMLDKSRKRGIDTTDGPRASGVMGERFQKRVKTLETGRRDRGNGRK